MPKDKSKTSHKDDTRSGKKEKDKEKSDSKWWSRKFANGQAGSSRGTRIREVASEQSVSETKAIPAVVDSSNSTTGVPETQSITSNAELEAQTEAQVSQSKSRQRLDAEESFKTAVEKLQNLMLQIGEKGNQKFVIDVIKIDKFSDFGTNVKEIGSAIDALMDKRTELRAQKSQITDIAEKWFKACFPFVKSGLNVASVSFNAVGFKEQVDEMITFLSETILHVQLLTITDLRGAVDEEQLEGFYFAGIKLSTAIVECLTIGIKLMTSNFERIQSTVSTAAKSREKDQSLVVAQAKVDNATKVYNTFIVDLNALMMSQFLAKEKKKEILSWLSSKNSWSRHNEFSQKRVSGSGTWFVESEEFKDWTKGTSEHVLIGWGNEGAGKSFIASRVIDHLKTDSASGLAFIYFDYKEDLSASELITTLLAQLTEQCQAPPMSIQSEYDSWRKGGCKLRPSDTRFLELLSEIVSEVGKVFVVLDAFDETKKEERGKIIEYLKVVCNAANLSLFITTRSPLVGLLKENFPESKELEITAQDNDIGNYLTEKLSAEHLHDKLKEQISTTLKAGAHGKFRLVEFQLKYVLAQGSPAKIKGALSQNSLPKSLSDAYRKVMDQMEEGQKKFAFQIMSWILHAARRLTMEELCEALSVEEDSKELQEELLPEPDSIVKACESLVEIDKISQKVRFTHQTVDEFLRDHCASEVLGVRDLAKTCLIYLTFSEFKWPCQSDEQLAARIEKHKFGCYAAEFWGHHTRGDPENDDNIQQRVLLLLTSENYKDSMVQMEQSRFLGLSRPRYPFITEQTLLHVFAWNGLATLCKQVLSRTINGNNTHITDSPQSPEWWVNQGDLSKRDWDGMTALHRAAYSGSAEVVKLLLMANADVNAPDYDGATALFRAAQEGHREVVKLLLEAKADVNATTENGATALHYAASNGHIEIVKFLLDAKANVDAENDYGQTALIWAAENRQKESVRVLVDAKANVNIRDCSGATALFLAAENNATEIVKMLMNAKANVDVQRTNGHTALIWAVYYDNVEIIKLLLDAKANVNVQDNRGSTALILAASTGSVRLVKMLVNANANVNLKDEYGQTAVSWAKREGYTELVKILEEAQQG